MSETRQWVERFEALRDDLATGDLHRVQKWAQNDAAFAEIAEGIARLARELEEARDRERALREALMAISARCYEAAMQTPLLEHQSMHALAGACKQDADAALAALRTPRGEGEAEVVARLNELSYEVRENPLLDAGAVSDELATMADTLAALRSEAPVGVLDKLRELICDVAASGVAFDDPRLRYVEIQIDRQTWDAVCALAATPSPDRGANG